MAKKVKEKKLIRKDAIFGLALGGGGARGFAHLGVLKALEENGITFDYVSGTSVGSLVGALYCDGKTTDEMIEFATNLSTKDIKKNLLFFIPDKSESIETLVKKYVSAENIEDLKKPLCVVAVDLITGKEVDLTKGDLAKSIAGSCAVPSIFAPVELDGMHLCDGGLNNTLPSDVLRNIGCDYVITVDVNPTRGYGTTSTKLFDVLACSIRIMMKSNALKGEMNSDIVIAPNLKKYSAASFNGSKEMIELGYNACMDKMEEIKKLYYKEEKKSFWEKFTKKK